MKDEVRKAMAEGALSLSTVLIYTPNIYAAAPEMAALAQTASQAGGIYTSHIRGEGYAFEGSFLGGKPYPRNCGSFPRVLGYYSRQLGLFTLEQAVRKMTGFTVDRLGMRELGYLKPGFFADLVIFDPQTVQDRATFTNPHQAPEGIQDIMGNGCWVIKKGKHTAARPGKII